jgi:myo-inositol 2-dehydrogenase / D-chiro-inositol 1-dehydrogenase
MRVGVVGAGVAGRRHLRRLLRNDAVTVAGVVERDPPRRETLAASTGVPTFPSLEALYEAGGVDALFVCVPPLEHGALEDLALAQGTPLFVEKPIAVGLDVAERIAERVRAAQVPVAVGYQWRQLSFLPRVVERLEGQETNLVVGSWMSPSATPGWWGDTRSAGGQLVEQATHLVELALHLVGPIVSVAGVASERRLGGRATGFAKASVIGARFANGAAGSFVATCTLAEPDRRALELFADGLAVCVTDVDCRVVADGTTTRWTHEGRDLYEREHDAFFAAVEGKAGGGPLVSYDEALAAHRIACEMERALDGAGSPAVPS